MGSKRHQDSGSDGDNTVVGMINNLGRKLQSFYKTANSDDMDVDVHIPRRGGYDILGGDKCDANCSGHGECLNGSCYCQIQFEGTECKTLNFSYHVAFASIFFLLALTSLIQLVMCIHAEYLRMKKNPSILRACRVTTQKFLYFLVFLASTLRGTYFAAPVSYIMTL